MSDDDLRLIARAGIADGRLPLIASQSMQASYGSGIKCHLCERPIEQQHIEYEVSDPRDGRRLSFHLACHGIWQLACRGGIRARPPDVPLMGSHLDPLPVPDIN